MQVTKEVAAAQLKDVERLATDSFRLNGYEPVQFISIADLGHNGRHRTWSVTAEVMKTGGPNVG